MTPEGKIHLPGFEGLPKVEPPRKKRFPRQERLGASLDLPTRKRIRSFLVRLQATGNFTLSDIFPTTDELPLNWKDRDEIHDYLALTRLCFYEYLPEEQIAVQLGWRPQSGAAVPKLAWKAYLRAVGRCYFGSRAIEILKPKSYLYDRLKEAGLRRVGEILALSRRPPRDEGEKDYPPLARICTSRPVFEELVTIIREKGYCPAWDPKVSFISELPPDKVARFLSGD